MERRFLITEVYKDGFGWATATPESEFKRRLALAYGAFSKSEDIEPKYTLDEAIDILINGKKEQPEPQPFHPVYTHCWFCHAWGMNLPGNTTCGNCGSTDTTEYHPRLNEPLVKPKPIILSRAEPVPVKADVDWPDPEDIIKMREKPAQPTRKEQPIKCSICGCDPLFAAGLRHFTNCPNYKEPNSQPTRKEQSEELRCAKQLATNLWEKHYKGSNPDWEPFDDLMGVLTQIDNMTCGLHGPKEQQDFPGPDDILKMRGKEQPIVLSRAEPVPAKEPPMDFSTYIEGVKSFHKPPKPTRKDWEEWIESFVEFSGFGLSRVGMATLIKIMLSMPGVPKP